MATKISKLLGKIHQGDCVEGLRGIPAESIDMAFADPPFNIGFEYDEYDDQLDDDQYLSWSRKWMAEIHRTLKPNGTFWLAIGDEYAAELKLEAEDIGFHCRSWVIWYYTFGVNCKKKFTRSHAHLFHFVKDKNNFTFNHADLNIRVPSARRLIYNDSRAAPDGRMPDDTWILRPQEARNGFDPDDDVWHFPRVAGTFKERAGFHGCQMPEQLLGRIVRSCSRDGEVIMDPFSGSSTTLAVAKKLGRKFLGFELSSNYVELGMDRLESIKPGDELDGGAQEPSMANLLASEKKSAKPIDADPGLFADDSHIHDKLNSEFLGVVESFSSVHRGYSVDRVVADPVFNEDFQLACDRRSIPGTPSERNRYLFRIRKAGRLKSHQIETRARTVMDWKDTAPFIFASEIAWRQLKNKYIMSLDEMFCDPRIAAQFDRIARQFAPGYEPLDYRWAALKLRKSGSMAKRRAATYGPEEFGISKFEPKLLNKKRPKKLVNFDFSRLKNEPGVYLVREPDGNFLYAGETDDLAARLVNQFGEDETRGMWLRRSQDLSLFVLPTEAIGNSQRFGRQSWLLGWYKPDWNVVKELANA